MNLPDGFQVSEVRAGPRAYYDLSEFVALRGGIGPVFGLEDDQLEPSRLLTGLPFRMEPLLEPESVRLYAEDGASIGFTLDELLG